MSAIAAAEYDNAPEVEDPWSLPHGWAWARASEFSKIVGGGTPRDSANPDNYAADGIPWITPADLSGFAGAYIGRGARSLSDLGFQNSSAKLLPKGTVLFSSRAPVGYCAVAANPVCTNQGFKSLVLGQGVVAEFVRYYMLYNRKYFVDAASGTTFKEISGSTLADLLFPIAPKTLQSRIVARIDELFTEIAEGEAALERARSGLDTWRRALLKAAVTGELTRDWRGANKSTDTADDLLSNIRFEIDADDPPARRGRYAGTPTPLDLNSLPELPPEWRWVRMADVTRPDTRNGISVKGSDQPPGIASLRLDALGDIGIDYTRIRFIDIDGEKIRALSLREGDFLISRANGSEHLVGKARLVRKVPFECVYPDTIIRYRIAASPLLAEWLEVIWESAFIRGQIVRMAKTTAGILKISQEDISRIVFPLPTLAEIAACIRLLSAHVQSANDALATLEKTVRDRAALRQSILKSAFEGRLVPQEPNDEPASVLLARLRAETPLAPPRGRKTSRYAASNRSPPLSSPAKAGDPVTTGPRFGDDIS
jgi:type I restriction enzyme, S subunit